MSFRVELHPGAVDDLQESYQWYEERSPGLGLRFVTLVNKKITEIAQSPERYPKKKGNFREAAIDVFPYVIIYEIQKKEKLIYITYLFHKKRNPLKKYKR